LTRGELPPQARRALGQLEAAVAIRRHDHSKPYPLNGAW
jgi:hypothetical protein